jgi:hypothetical protein
MFLPKLEQANKEIEQEIKNDPSLLQNYDIEHTDETNGPLIEMVEGSFKFNSPN